MTHKDFFLRGLVGLFVATVFVGIAWLLAAAISPDLYAKALGGDMEKVTLGSALSVTLIDGAVGVLIGWILFWRNKPRTWWYVAVAIVMIWTTIEAVAWADTTETTIWLMIFHIVAAAAITPAVAVSLRDRSSSAPINGSPSGTQLAH